MSKMSNKISFKRSACKVNACYWQSSFLFSPEVEEAHIQRAIILRNYTWLVILDGETLKILTKNLKLI